MHVCTTHSVRQDRGVLGPQAECFGGGGGGGARRAKSVLIEACFILDFRDKR